MEVGVLEVDVLEVDVLEVEVLEVEVLEVEVLEVEVKEVVLSSAFPPYLPRHPLYMSSDTPDLSRHASSVYLAP